MTADPDEKAQHWGVWCTPAHEKTRWQPEHWWGQFWRTDHRIPFGEPVAFDTESDARTEADNLTRIDTDGVFRYAARTIPEKPIHIERSREWWLAKARLEGDSPVGAGFIPDEKALDVEPLTEAEEGVIRYGWRAGLPLSMSDRRASMWPGY